MALAHQSIATINSPEFINLQPLDINPLMSSCQIKVFYLGENRNGTYISKEVASNMAKTLRGAPIVGYFKDEKEDFADHGKQIILDDEGIHFNVLTKPYGFVAPNAQVWFQDFEDFDDFGNSILRTYLMTSGYLWTGQFEQAKLVTQDGGRPQSMELDEKTVTGKWSTNIKENMEFFIINDAIVSKLCILGNDVQPCFEGAAITNSDPATSFTIDKDFKQTLFSMMEELKQALKGDNQMANIEKNISSEELEQVTDFTQQEENNSFTQESDNNTDVSSSFAKEEEEEKEDVVDKEDTSESEGNNNENDDKEDDEEKKKYSLLEDKYNQLKEDYTKIEQENVELKAFKKNVEDAQKDELINEFSMLSEEDKKEVIENKSNYTLDEIKSKLAVICFEKRVNFNSTIQKENEENTEVENLFTLNIEEKEDSTPDWVKAVEATMDNMNK